MLKWVVTGMTSTQPGQAGKAKSGGRAKEPHTNTTEKSMQLVSKARAQKDTNLEKTNASNIDDAFHTEYNISKRTSTSGEVDSLLDHTDSFSEDFQAPESIDANKSTTVCDNNGGAFQDDAIFICHGQNQDSGICTDINHDTSESCYNSGTDTSFDTPIPCITHVTMATDLSNVCNGSEVPKVLNGKNKSVYNSQICANSLITTNTSSSSDSSNCTNKRKTQSKNSKTATIDRVVITCDNRTDIGESKQLESDNDTDSSSVDICEVSIDFTDDFLDDSEVIRGGYKSDSESVDDVFDTDHPFLDDSKECQVSIKNSEQGDDLVEQEQIHQKRSRLVEQIDREQKLKAGAQNLYKASENRRLRETISVEIRFIESHIKLLTDELADLDITMESKQPNQQCNFVFPMIQIGFKETKDVACRNAFKDFILEHYFENEDYEKEIEAFENMRQLTRSPIRNEGGIELLLEYYNHLYFIDKRFFSANRKLGVFFEWFDSISGKLTMQKTVGFEKGSQLFNIGALYSHIAAHQKRSTEKEMLRAREYFQKAAGALRHLCESFSNAPSTDMQPHTLKILIHLMMCQAEECQYDSVKLNADPQTTEEHITLSQHAALLYEMYRYARQQMHFDCIKDYIPHNWHILVQVKTLFFKAVSNFHAAKAIMATYTLQNEDQKEKDLAIQDIFEPLAPSRMSLNIAGNAQDLDDLAASRFFKPGDETQRKYLAKACLSRSVLAHEEALRVHKTQRRVKRIPYYHDVHQLLKTYHDKCFKQYSVLEEEDDFTELAIVPNIKRKSTEEIASIPPDFSKHKVTDFFQRLGPLAIFCAKHEWSAPLRVDMHKKSGQGFGFSVRGDSPVIIAEVDSGSLAERAGMTAGDFIVQIDSRDVKWSNHEEVVKLIRATGHRLVLRIITPLDKNYLKPRLHAEYQDTTEAESQDTKARARHRAINSRSLDRNLCRSDHSRSSTKSFTWTLRKFRGRQKNTFHVKEIMQDDNIKNSR